jgi:predicted dehydrogenase
MDHDMVVRIGVLGAARIAPPALVKPVRKHDRAEVVAVAARDRARAEKFAGKHGIPTVYDDYAALIAAPDIDAIYNPLPNGLHAEWTTAALEAGKHVLCEKPLTANAAEAEALAVVAQRTGLVLMEAFHWRYHPQAKRMVEIVRSGELGELRHVEAAMCFPLPRFSDIRYQYDLAGGALMDAGCYTVHIVRTLGGNGGEEPEVVSATATLHNPDVDRAMRAELRFPSGATGAIHTSMWSKSLLKLQARVVGDKGEMRVFNPTTPQLYSRLKVKAHGGSRVEHFPRVSTYECQLDAFCDAVVDGAPTLTPPSESIANMRVIDDIYRAAGMKVRGT